MSLESNSPRESSFFRTQAESKMLVSLRKLFGAAEQLSEQLSEQAYSYIENIDCSKDKLGT